MLLLFSFVSLYADAQEEVIRNLGNRLNRAGGRIGGGEGADSLQRRDKNEDSITISFRLFNATQSSKLDSSITDFIKRFPIPATHIYLGNLGNASRSLLFSPQMEAGFDAGFHAFDIYTWQLKDARFFQTTRPYSEINYFLGSRTEQLIELLHTQNIKPNWNAMFKYRLINSPGFFKGQKTNHNNYTVASRYQSKNLRYTNYFLLLANKMISAENGGIVDTSNILDDPIYKDRFNIPTYLGGDEGFSSNFFSTNISTGNRYSYFTALLRQQYDLGKKDSIVTDSTVIPLFFPRLRFEHTLQLDQNKFQFQDAFADSLYYDSTYGITIKDSKDTLSVKDSWKILTNDLSIYQFPDAKNLGQYIKLGVMLQNITGSTASGDQSFFNTAGHVEYRNKTRNHQWDIEANGRLFFTGFNAGDYHALISLERLLGKKIGYLRLGFANSSRTPSFLFDSRSSFYYLPTNEKFNKENTTQLSASYFLPSFRLRLSGNYYLLTNYTYLTAYTKLKQQNGLFNVLQLSVEKTIKLGKSWNWHADVYFQQVIGNAELNLPVLYTRNRIAYEGNLGFKNLDIAFGAEFRYRSAYKADGYSPVLGRFFYQDSITIRNPLPDISAYVHFRIRSMKFYIRTENLNTARTLDGFGFTNNNLVAPGYPLPGMQFRLGVWWNFVN
ncbi:MAG TPA: hypothetical protein PLU37_10360 [Chitinophagaceae bacterium]|nr:hypothetical protein [Chitinophagaceae bacterium]